MDYTYELIVRTSQDDYHFKGIYYCQDESDANMLYNKIKSQYKDDARWMIVVKDSNSKIVYSILLSHDNDSEI